MSLGIGVLVLGTTTFLLADASRRVAARFWGGDLLAQVTAATVCFATMLVLLLEVIGLLGLFHERYVVAGTVLVWAAVFAWSRRTGAPPPPPHKRAGRDGRPSISRSWLPVLALTAGLGVLVLTKYLSALHTPDPHFDALAGHLPVAVEWFQAGNLRFLPWIEPLEVQAQYPANAELVALWLFLPVGRDYLVALADVPGLLMLVSGTALTARELGARPLAVVATALVVPSLPGALRLIVGTNMQDLMMLGGLAALAAFAAMQARKPSPAGVMIAGLAAGIAVGTRYAALGIVPVVCALVVLQVLRRGWRKALKTAAVVAAGAVLTGGYWYVRNAVYTGSPFYPGSLPGQHIVPVEALEFPQLRSYAELGWAPTHWVHAAQYAATDYGVVWLVLVLLSPVFLVLAALRRERSATGWAWASLPLFCLLVFAFQIGSAGKVDANGNLREALQSVQLRYLFATVSLSVIVLAAEARHLPERFDVPLWTTTIAVVAVTAMIQVVPPAQSYLWGLAALAGAVLAVVIWLRAPPMVMLGAGAAGLVAAALFANVQAQHYEQRRLAGGMAFELAAEHLRESDNSVAIAGFCQLYAIYRPDWSRRVQYLTGYDDVLDRPLGAGYQLWLASLRRHQVTALVIGLDPCYRRVGEVDQARFAREHPEVFSEVFADGIAMVYRVAPPR